MTIDNEISDNEISDNEISDNTNNVNEPINISECLQYYLSRFTIDNHLFNVIVGRISENELENFYEVCVKLITQQLKDYPNMFEKTLKTDSGYLPLTSDFLYTTINIEAGRSITTEVYIIC